MLVEFVVYKMLDKKDAIRKDGSSFIFRCRACPSEIKSKDYYLVKHSGLCRSCCVKKKPFEHLYNKFLNSAKFEKHNVSITFDNFLSFTEKKECHYCHIDLVWTPYLYENSKYKTGAYLLDRMDNSIGYSMDNIAQCCTKCNIAKSDNFTYEDWYGMTKYLRDKKGEP